MVTSPAAVDESGAGGSSDLSAPRGVLQLVAHLVPHFHGTLAEAAEEVGVRGAVGFVAEKLLPEGAHAFRHLLELGADGGREDAAQLPPLAPAAVALALLDVG